MVQVWNLVETLLQLWPMNTLYNINNINRITSSDASNVIFVTGNSTNKCNVKNHVIFTDAACFFFYLGFRS